jgi:hypothetical protein
VVAPGVSDADAGEESVPALIKSVAGNASPDLDAQRDPQAARRARSWPSGSAVRRCRAVGGCHLAGLGLSSLSRNCANT